MTKIFIKEFLPVNIINKNMHCIQPNIQNMYTVALTAFRKMFVGRQIKISATAKCNFSKINTTTTKEDAPNS